MFWLTWRHQFQLTGSLAMPVLLSGSQWECEKSRDYISYSKLATSIRYKRYCQISWQIKHRSLISKDSALSLPCPCPALDLPLTADPALTRQVTRSGCGYRAACRWLWRWTPAREPVNRTPCRPAGRLWVWTPITCSRPWRSAAASWKRKMWANRPACFDVIGVLSSASIEVQI